MILKASIAERVKQRITQAAEQVAVKRIRLGVTGFSGSGKTVYLGALVQALLTAHNQHLGGPLAGFSPFERGILRAARIRDDLHPTSPQFPFRAVRDSLLGADNRWPEPTTGISRLTLELDTGAHTRLQKLLHDKLGLSDVGMGRVLLELVDFPGEWLVDLPMLGQDFRTWSNKLLADSQTPARAEFAQDYQTLLNTFSTDTAADEALLEQLQQRWTGYLQQAFNAGFSYNQPGRHLRPDKLEHSPVLRFAPLPDHLIGSKLYAQAEKRFGEYQQQVIKPFYQDTFSQMDRQLVLVDVLRALEQGQFVFDDMCHSLSAILKSFHYGKGGLLAWLGQAQTTKVLFAATKADHIVRGDRTNLEQLLGKMLALVDDTNQLRASAKAVGVMSLASIAATEDRATTEPPIREVLYGKPLAETEAAHWDPGGLPLDMPPQWANLNFAFYRFQPLAYQHALQQGFPAINLGRSLQFLLGEDLQ